MRDLIRIKNAGQFVLVGIALAYRKIALTPGGQLKASTSCQERVFDRG